MQAFCRMLELYCKPCSLTTKHNTCGLCSCLLRLPFASVVFILLIVLFVLHPDRLRGVELEKDKEKLFSCLLPESGLWQGGSDDCFGVKAKPEALEDASEIRYFLPRSCYPLSDRVTVDPLVEGKIYANEDYEVYLWQSMKDNYFHFKNEFPLALLQFENREEANVLGYGVDNLLNQNDVRALIVRAVSCVLDESWRESASQVRWDRPNEVGPFKQLGMCWYEGEWIHESSNGIVYVACTICWHDGTIIVFSVSNQLLMQPSDVFFSQTHARHRYPLELSPLTEPKDINERRDLPREP